MHAESFLDRIGPVLEASGLEDNSDGAYWSQDEFVYNEKYPFANVLPDVWPGPGSEWGAELKAPRPWRLADCRLKNGLLKDWIVQAQHNMAITEANVWYVSLWDCVTYRPYWWEVVRDQSLIGKMMARERCVWDYAKINVNPPIETVEEEVDEVTIGDETYKQLDTPEVREIAELYLEVRQTEGHAGAQKKILQKRLVALFPEGTVVGEIPGILKFHNKMRDGRAKFDKKACLKDHPEMREYESIGADFPEFRTYPQGAFKDRYAIPSK